MTNEQQFCLALVQMPNLARDALDLLEPEFFESPPAKDVIRAAKDCADTGELPTLDRVRALLTQRGQAYDLSGGAIWSRQQFVETAERISSVGRKRELVRALEKVIRFSQDHIGNDAITPTELGDRARLILDNLGMRGVPKVRMRRDMRPDFRQRVEALSDGSMLPRLWPTGVQTIDNRLLFGPSKITVIAARSGDGKTSFAGSIVERVLQVHPKLAGAHIALADMSPLDLYARSVAEYAQVNSRKPMLLGVKDDDPDMQRLLDGEHRMLEELGDRFADMTSGFEVGQILATIRRCVATFSRRGYRPGIFIIDYAQVVRLPGSDDEFKPIKELARKADALARELDISIVILTQLNSKGTEAIAKDGDEYVPSCSHAWAGTKLRDYCSSFALVIKRGDISIAPQEDKQANGLVVRTREPPEWLRGAAFVDLHNLKGRDGSVRGVGHLHFMGAIRAYSEPANSPATHWRAGRDPRTGAEY